MNNNIVIARFKNETGSICEVVDMGNIYRGLRVINNIDNSFESIIYINPKHKKQPAYIPVQKIAFAFNKMFGINQALILGCAGCVIPRFFNFAIPNAVVTGIEYSAAMIKAAKKYFFTDTYKKFKLLHGDAYQYVADKNCGKYQDFIYVDLFEDSDISKGIFEKRFTDRLIDKLNDNGVIVYNVLGAPASYTAKISGRLNSLYNKLNCHVYDITKPDEHYLVILKTKDTQANRKFRQIIY